MDKTYTVEEVMNAMLPFVEIKSKELLMEAVRSKINFAEVRDNKPMERDVLLLVVERILTVDGERG